MTIVFEAVGQVEHANVLSPGFGIHCGERGVANLLSYNMEGCRAA